MKPNVCIKIISGGQTGADSAGLQAAKELNISTGGYAATNYQTEVGCHPILGSEYGLIPVKSKSNKSVAYNYVQRSIKNVDLANATIAFRLHASVGTDKTIGYCQTGKWQTGEPKTKLDGHRPVLVVTDLSLRAQTLNVIMIRDFITNGSYATINICGHRASSTYKGYTEDIIKLLKMALKVFTKE